MRRDGQSSYSVMLSSWSHILYQFDIIYIYIYIYIYIQIELNPESCNAFDQIDDLLRCFNHACTHNMHIRTGADQGRAGPLAH